MRKFIHFTQPLFGKEEKKEVLDALSSGWVTLGPRTKQFEEDFAKYVGAKYAIAVTSCTAGIHISLIAAGIKPGDEIITSPFTFVASVNPIIHLGAKPVMVDIDPVTFNIDPDKIEEKITKRTKAILPVHYGGQGADMDKILRIAKKHNLKVIEDAAHASGSSFGKKKIGTHGDLVNFSFHPVKNMSTGDGGMITTNNEEYASLLMMLRLHGMSKDAWKRHSATGSWRYDIEMPGYKYNMTDISAALGIQQLKKLDGFIKTRQDYAMVYDHAFSDIPEITIPVKAKNRDHIYSLYTILLDTSNLKISRDEIVDELKKAQIGVSVYFIPVHLFSYYKNTYKYKVGNFPQAEAVFEKIISLPLYPKMSPSDLKYVIKTLKKLILKNRK